MTAEISKKCRIAHFLPFTVHISITKGNSERLLAGFSKLSRQMLRLKEISQLPVATPFPAEMF